MMENSQIEEPDYLDGRYVYEPDFSQVGADPEDGTGTGPDEAPPATASE